jgi:hypothetical protein
MTALGGSYLKLNVKMTKEGVDTKGCPCIFLKIKKN